MKITTALKKVIRLKKRKKIIRGGTYAGKSYVIITHLINLLSAKYPKRIKCTVVAESVPAVKLGALAIFREQMEFIGYWFDDCYNATERIFTFDSGNSIQFTSFDKVGKAKAAGKRDILFLNEVNHIDREICLELISRTDGDVYMDYNPDAEFWVDSELMRDPEAEMLTLTYKDNEALSEVKLRDLEFKRELAKTSDYWANWCKVYLDGEIGSLQGVVYSNWKKIDSVPADAKLIRHGLDFGFSNDPMAGVSIYQYNNSIVVHEILYKTNMSISELVYELKHLPKGAIMCDSSQPMLISELKKAGLNAQPCVKGKDSINYGIGKIQEMNMLITADSVNLIKELRGYVWDGDHPKGEDHLLDALRYGIVTENKPKVRGGIY